MTSLPMFADQSFGDMTSGYNNVHTLSEADWMEAAKFEGAISNTQASQGLGLAMVGVMAILVYAYIPPLELLAWTLAAIFLAVVRYGFCRRFATLGATQSMEAQLRFARRNPWIWPLHGAVWVSCTGLLLGRLPPQMQAVCWMLLAGVVGVAVLRISAHLGVVRLYLFSAMATLVASVSLRIMWGAPSPSELESVWLAGMMGVYLLLLFRVALLQHEAHVNRIELRYHNARLIYSLVQQTRVAREAILFKDRFLASAAHDLKQPVNALAIYAEWLVNEPESSPELAPKILQATRAVNTLFDSMFDLVKLDAGHFGVQLRPVDLRRLFSDMEAQFRPMATEKGLDLRIRLPEAITLQSDAALMQRILGNLLGNAIRYTRSGGVLMGVRRDAEGLRIEVWDTGIGIAPVLQERIFSEFYKVQSGGTEEGFGLGLAIVTRLAGLLQYRVSVRSRPDRGSVFCVHVPQKAVEAVHREAPA